ncbi:MAG: hypothetical protein HY305_06520 [Sphingobacteriales bacterium]|nr:hypothetical protein [Sphingobacteriales bacterium]
MTKRIFSIFLIALVFISCNNNEKPTTAIDTGRLFIRTTLDGNFTDAEPLLYKDTINIELFDSYKNFYNSHISEADKKSYKESDYTINKYQDLNDSTAVINYSNSYMKKPMEVKIIRDKGEWKIDFKHTSAGNTSN